MVMCAAGTFRSASIAEACVPFHTVEALRPTTC